MASTEEKRDWIDLHWQRSGVIGKLLLVVYLQRCRWQGKNPLTNAYINPPERAEVSRETMVRMGRLFREGIL